MVDPSPRSARAYLALALLLSVLGSGCATETKPERQPTVLLISIDTLRADALSCYGNPRPTTPVLDALAADGVRFSEVLAHAPSTAPSHASIFTGVTPWAHRVTNVARGGKGYFKLLPEFETLAEAYAARGYATAAFTDGGPFAENWELGQGFDLHDNAYEGVEFKVDKLLAHLDDSADDERSRFLFLHTYEVHQPLLPPQDVLARFRSDPSYEGTVRQKELGLRKTIKQRGSEAGAIKAKDLIEGHADFTAADVAYLWDLYSACLAYTDAELGRLFDGLRERGLYDDMVIVVTSDHGEEFGEHGRFGHNQLHRETLHVPLILHLPADSPADWRGRVVDERIGHVDVNATLLELANAPVLQSTGTSLLEGLRSGRFSSGPVFAQSTTGFNIDAEAPAMYGLDRAVFDRDQALLQVQAPVGDLHSLFAPLDVPRPGVPGSPPVATQLVLPGGEVESTGDQASLDQLAELSELVRAHLAAAAALRASIVGDANGYGEFDAETSAQMEALGYIDGE